MKYKIFTILIIDCLISLICLIPAHYNSQSGQQIFFEGIILIGFSVFTWKFLDLINTKVMFEMLIGVVKVIIGVILFALILIYVLIPVTCSFF